MKFDNVQSKWRADAENEKQIHYSTKSIGSQLLNSSVSVDSLIIDV